ncbi:MAG: hypothetical protein RLO18_11770, partial [Gimesia chilikensis]
MPNASRSVRFQIRCLCLLLILSGWHITAECGVIYVDNRAGNNSFNGIALKTTNGKNGPVKTIQRALEYAGPGDKIILINNDLPYEEALTLSGKRHSGLGTEKFTMLGYGATIRGAITVPHQGW